MSTYELALQDRREIAEGTVSLKWEKPKDFEFRAGQFLEFFLPDTDEGEDEHAFSIASAPWEPELQVVTRARESVFKDRFLSLPIGSRVRVEGPMGRFQLHDDADQPAVFVAGGIGVTPFRSMIVEKLRVPKPPPMVLFFANRRPEDAAFLSELIQLERDHERFHFVPTMTRMKESEEPWEGEAGYIDKNMLARHLENLEQPICYVAGPPGMVSSMIEVLRNIGVPSSHMRAEKFAGY